MPSVLAISVALCTHNGERFVAEQVRSILRQSRLPAQLVVSDDASTDATVSIVSSIVAEWRSQHPDVGLDVVLIRNATALGVTANFAGAIAATTGDLVALADQDDLWPRVKLERMAAEFESRSELLLLHSDASLIDDVGRSLDHTLFGSLGVSASMVRSVHAGNALALLMKRNIVTGATTVFRRELADAAAPFPPSWLHDEWLAIVAAATGVVDVVDEPLLEYRQHGANQIGVQKLSFAGKIRRMLEPGAERNDRLLRRAEQLAERLQTLDTSSAARAAGVAKLTHEQVRSALSDSRWARCGAVARELATGRYREFGRGFPDALRDLLQPL